MKPICILLYLLSLTACFGDHFKDAMIKQAPDVNLAGTLPERYDWLNYIDDAKSVSGEMLRAWAGIKHVEPRLERILEECRAILKTGERDLQAFEKIYKLWAQADDIEVGWVSQSMEGGSQRRAAVPRARLRTMLRRIQALQELKENSGLFNQ